MVLTVEQVAEGLQVSTSKLRRLTRAGRIPHLKIGRLVRYELDRVTDALRVPAQTVAPRLRAMAPPAPTPRRARGGAPAQEPLWLQVERQRIHAANRAAKGRTA